MRNGHYIILYVIKLRTMINKDTSQKLMSSKLLLLILSTVTLISIVSIPNSVFAQGTTESDAVASEEASSKDPITLINEIRGLLTQANNQYVAGDQVGAAETVRVAYLDHYEFLEGPLAALDPTLMEATEILIREDLVAAMENNSSVAVVQDLLNTINTNLDKAELLFQQA